MSLFKTFQKDRKIETTPFDLSFQNILTANFGGLTPLASYPVLPKDRFKIGSNILTKVEPMPAPAFCRIKQNTYAFFTPNSTVWKHWNDYVTNGTAYADTYGNNANNQKIDNQWRPPQVSTNDIQLISKLANGWAIPVFRLSQLYCTILIRTLYNSLSDDNKAYVDGLVNPTSTTEAGADIANIIFSLLLALNQLQNTDGYLNSLVELFECIPYYECAFDRIQASKHSVIDWSWHIDFGCDLVTCCRFTDLLFQINNSFLYVDPVQIYQEPVKSYAQRNSFECLCVRPFSDNYSNDLRLSHSPFVLEKKTFVNDTFTGGRPINYYVYKKNLYQDLVNNNPYSSNSPNPANYRAFTSIVRNCGSFWNLFISGSSTKINVNGIDLSSTDSGLLEGLLSSYFMLSLHTFRVGSQYNSLFYSTNRSFSLWAENADAPTQIPLIGSYAQLTETSHDYAFDYVNPFVMAGMAEPYETVPIRSVDGLEPISNVLFSRRWNNFIDIDLPVFCDNYRLPVFGDLTHLSHQYGKPFIYIPFTYESYNLGYDTFSFLIYLCQNSAKLLDYFNIPLEGLTARSWDFYAGEFIQVLPFFSYSKIWNDYFRNKVTSSAELDYSETNGIACFSEHDAGFLGSYPYKMPLWFDGASEVDEFLNDFLNGWSLPFSCAPKNSMQDTSIQLSNNVKINISDINHFHDLRIRNHWSLLSVLTGWQLQNVTLNSVVNSFDIDTGDLYGILAEKFYLPSYYNGLFHYKYQNFNKDYFSSALLDPAAGANDEKIGTTVSSLVTAQAKQGFWNRLANNRSVKQFWNSVFGIDPSHDEYDKPLLLGSAHTDVNVGEVIQLSQTDATPQGQRSGLGSSHDKHGLCNKQFNEHGYVLILVSHTLELQYMQGLEKDWTPANSFLDLPFIDFVGLGNQSINQRELDYTAMPLQYRSSSMLEHSPDWFSSSAVRINVASGFSFDKSKINNIYPSSPQLMTQALPFTPINSSAREAIVNTSLTNGSGFSFDDIFGYIPRYSTWKFKFDQCHGEFRNQLDFWHAFRRFFTQPILCHEFVNWEFMSENDELGRMFFVLDDSTDKFKLDAFINCTAYRPLPYVCVPATSKS